MREFGFRHRGDALGRERVRSLEVRKRLLDVRPGGGLGIRQPGGDRDQVEIGLLLLAVTVVVNGLARFLVWSVGGPARGGRE